MFLQRLVSPRTSSFLLRSWKATTLLSLMFLLAGLSARLAAQTNEWTWMGGSNTANQPGVYGSLGTPAAGNTPGSRAAATSWIDTSGDLWLFGGNAVDVNGSGGDINDLWKYTQSTGYWTWMGGSSTAGQAGVYGALGSPDPGNVPGAREGPVSWVDSSGHFWLLGGLGYDANGNLGYLNDLWEYFPATSLWAWMGGGNTRGQPGVFGTLGVPDPGNVPPAHAYSVQWTDSSGNFWFFGGNGPGFGRDNDLWEYNPSTNLWAWMAGSSAESQPGVYGTLGTPAPGNTPGGRYAPSAWTDAAGHLWLFGGQGRDSTGSGDSSFLNDLWEYDTATNQWAWMGGSNIADQGGVYGAQGTPAPGNVPGGRSGAVSWTDHAGNLWLFGGLGLDGSGGGPNSGLNDLWNFNTATNQWTWMSGSSTGNQSGVYGTLGTPDVGNVPGNHWQASGWTDKSGNLWLFGGNGLIGGSYGGPLNDLWKFTLQPSAAAATPVLSPAAGSYSSTQTVTISDATSGATIHYTVDGSVPTASSAVYSAPLTVAFSQTISAIAVADGYLNSAVASATYTITRVAPPSFSEPGGSYTSIQSVAISDVTPGAWIYYTTNGATPTTLSTPYFGPIEIAATTTVRAIALAPGLTQSLVSSATYTITLPLAATPAFSPVAGTYNAPQLVSILDSTADSAIYYTTDGTTPTVFSTPYIGPFNVSTSETVKAIAVAYGYRNSAVATAVYRMVTPAPVVTPPGGSYMTPQTVMMADPLAGATIYYTLDGSTPVPGSSPAYAAPMTFSTTTTVKAIAAYAGFQNSSVVSRTYTINLTVAKPVATPAPGTFGLGQMVTLSTATSGATIYYTTDGTIPTAASPAYSGPIAVTATQTIRAIATLAGWADSGVGGGTYRLVGTPMVLTGLASSIATPGATLNATVNDANVTGQVWFLWGTSSTNLGSTTSPVTLPASGSSQPVGIPIDGLASGTQYYFQPVVQTIGGVSYGAVQSFMTN